MPDRIGIHIEVPRVGYETLSNNRILSRFVFQIKNSTYNITLQRLNQNSAHSICDQGCSSNLICRETIDSLVLSPEMVPILSVHEELRKQLCGSDRRLEYFR